MAKKKTTTKKKSTGASRSKKSTKSTRSRKKQVEVPALHPETKKWVVGILMFVVAAIGFLALFNLAGPGGEYLLTLMQLLFGSLAFLFPLLLVIGGYISIHRESIDHKAIAYLGGGLFILSFTALFNIFTPVEEIVDLVAQGDGGGYVGLILSYVLMNMVGFIASLIILIALTIIGLLLIVNSSLDDLADKENAFGSFLAAIQARWYDLRYGDLDKEEDEEEWQDDEEFEEEVHGDDMEDPGFTSKKLDEGDQAPSFTPSSKIQEVGEEVVAKPKKKVTYKKVDIPLNLLEESSGTASSGNPIRTKEKIKTTFASFNIPVEMGEVNVGPTVTQYELIPAEGVKLSRITALQDDLALSLAAHPLRIEAPIPGKAAVGVEIPNTSVEMVRLKELLLSKSFKTRKSPLQVTLGKDVSGKAWTTPLDKMPHLLVAGATGSGKSVCVNSIITSLLYQNSPETLRFIMVDPKKVELSAYSDIPHLLTPVITDTKKTVNALKWAVAEMDRRYTLLQKAGKRHIDDYNKAAPDKLPYIVFIIDEMADLMVASRNEVETLIIRLAQMARAVGIHLVLATQRPSVDVITGLIKANVPTRIAFAVASSMDSRTILDSTGAEKLVGKGDMLFSNPQYKKPVRIQGAFLSDDEIKKVTDYIKENYGEPDYSDEVTSKSGDSGGGVDFSDPDEGDELFEDAKEIVVMAGKASTSFLQRKLKIGYSRAARIMDLLEEAGIVGEAEGSKAREILVGKEEIGHDEVSGYDVQPDEVQPSYEEFKQANEMEEQAPEVEENDKDDTIEEVEEDEEDETEELDEALDAIDEIEEEQPVDEEDEEDDDWV